MSYYYSHAPHARRILTHTQGACTKRKPVGGGLHKDKLRHGVAADLVRGGNADDGGGEKKRPLSSQAARAATVVKKWVKNESGLQLTFNENASECVAMQKGSRSSRFEGNRS